MNKTLSAFKYWAYVVALFLGLLKLEPVKAQERCASMQLLNARLAASPSLRLRFSAREADIERIVSARLKSGQVMRSGELATIPVVFHVIVRSQGLVTDAQIQAQLDTLNKDFSGTNAGASRVPSYFQSVFGRSGIQFCLAQRTPDNQPSTGINRYTTTKTNFNWRTDEVKHAETGGVNAWDPNSYLNIWICAINEDILGYASFPDDGVPAEQGVVINYTSLPGGSATNYNAGKTLTHEVGHYFNLYHIWGDDDGACTGSDLVNDTPNQGNRTSSCRTGVVTDNCTTTSPGIMYQNFMDYTPDNCLLMFTAQQVIRMEAAYQTFRSLMGSSLGCQPIALRNKDASLRTINQPPQRLCSQTFSPTVTIRNTGRETLTSLRIFAGIDGQTPTGYTWTGSLASYAQTQVTLPAIVAPEGEHVLLTYTSSPNGAADEDLSNDTLRSSFIYYRPVIAPVTEGFEASFPSVRWDIVNEDGLNTWQANTLARKTGSRSARIRNFVNTSLGQRDYLRSPTVNIAGTDSVFVSFQLAAATYSNTGQTGTAWDTLQVLVSTDCGLTYTSVYKKWGVDLRTRASATQSEFVPAASEWRKEEINIGQFIPQGEILVAFLNSNGNQNDIYLDDINIRTVTVNPFVKESGFLVSPNPTSDVVSVQFYPHPETLRQVQLFTASGQKVVETVVPEGGAASVYNYDLRHLPPGIYVVKAIFSDKVLTKKVVKVH